MPSFGIASCVGTVEMVMDHSWLGTSLLSCLRAGTAWGLYLDLVFEGLSSRYNHQYGLYFETRLLGSRAGFKLGSFRSQGARSAI